MSTVKGNVLSSVYAERTAPRRRSSRRSWLLRHVLCGCSSAREDLDNPLSGFSFEDIFLLSFRQSNNLYLGTKRKQYGITVAGGNGHRDNLNQLFLPEGIFVDQDRTIYIADSGNHRIVEWKYNAKSGRIVAGGYGKGNQHNQLYFPKDVIVDKESDSFIISDWGNNRIMLWPRQSNTHGQIIISDINCEGLAMDKNGFIYVADGERNEVRRWKIGDNDGTIVAGGNGKGSQLNQLNHPTYIFVDDDDSLYVSDSANERVMKWIKDAKVGIVVAGGKGTGNSLAQLSLPSGVTADRLGQIYVADCANNRVIRLFEGAIEGSIVVGTDGKEKKSNKLNGPIGLSFDRQGSLYVVDSLNHRIQKFEID